jgi:hypothetical protein
MRFWSLKTSSVYVDMVKVLYLFPMSKAPSIEHIDNTESLIH